VRGLDNATAPGGMTNGIDHEAPLGAAQTYTAVATNGLATVSSTTATASVAAVAGFAWLKSLRTPSLSVQVMPQKWPDWSLGIAQSVLPVLDSKFPSVNDGTRQARSGAFTVLTRTLTELANLEALLNSGGPYLLQPTAQSGEPDMYVRVGAAVPARVAGISSEQTRAWQLPLTVVKRPSTGGSTVALPGRTFADSLIAHPLFSDRSGTFGTG
jgi:hypothetical protein